MVEFIDENLQGSHFRRVDLGGSRFHAVELQNVKITDAFVEDMELSGYIRRLTVNGVDVGEYVTQELEARHPELKQLQADDIDGLRIAWQLIEEAARATVERARSFPSSALDESVDGEWSYIQTLRHLVMATDRWITGPVFADPKPFHPLGYPHDGAEETNHVGLDLDARPSLDEILEARTERLERVREFLRTASTDDVARIVTNPNGGTTSVASCIRVVLNEEWWHNQYANRDLTVLAARDGG